MLVTQRVDAAKPLHAVGAAHALDHVIVVVANQLIVRAVATDDVLDAIVRITRGIAAGTGSTVQVDIDAHRRARVADRVVASTAVKHICASTANQEIVAIPAIYGVITITAIDHIIAGQAIDCVIAGEAVDRIVVWRSVYGVIAAIAIDRE